MWSHEWLLFSKFGTWETYTSSPGPWVCCSLCNTHSSFLSPQESYKSAAHPQAFSENASVLMAPKRKKQIVFSKLFSEAPLIWLITEANRPLTTSPNPARGWIIRATQHIHSFHQQIVSDGPNYIF